MLLWFLIPISAGLYDGNIIMDKIGECAIDNAPGEQIGAKNLFEYFKCFFVLHL